MILQDRDIKIVNYIEQIKGATINHIAQLYFKGSYDAAKKRLKLLEENKQIKGNMHYVLNKKVYYTGKIPSYHRIITNEIKLILSQNVNVLDFKYEAKINKYKVDALCVYKKNKVEILLIEVDIYNRTTDTKIENVIKELKTKTGIAPKVAIVSLHKRRGVGAGIINIGTEDINNIVRYI